MSMSEKTQPNYYSIIPASVRYDSDLKANEKLIYGEITALCDNLGYCWATNDYFAKLYQVSRETVSRWINNLVKKGYLYSEIIYKENSSEIINRVLKIDKNLDINLSNLYRKRDIFPIDDFVNRVLTKKSIDYCQKNQESIDEKVKENNTSINNSNNKKGTESNEDSLEEQFEMPPEVFSEIFPIIEKEFGRLITPLETEMIRTWDYSVEILKLAVSEASTNGQFSMRYIDKIIYNWKKANVRTVDEARKYIKNFHERKEQRISSVGQAPTSANAYGSYEVLV